MIQIESEHGRTGNQETSRMLECWRHRGDGGVYGNEDLSEMSGRARDAGFASGRNHTGEEER